MSTLQATQNRGRWAHAQSKKRQAATLLAFYLRQAYEAGGLTWTNDNELEVAEIVDAILDAADAQAPVLEYK